MDIEICDSYDEISRKAKDIIIESLVRQRELKLCAATGGSPTGMYKELAMEFEKNPHLFNKLQVIKLDEWGGIPMEHPGTCESYLQQHFIRPLNIDDERYLSFQSNPTTPLLECKRIEQELNQMAGIDICILGLGMNGHLALNEPADNLQAECHVAQLDSQSLQHPMLGDGERPKYGLTLGMANILKSRQIILLINGIRKKDIALRLLKNRKITTHLPASFLWLHPNVKCLIDKEAY